MPMRLHGLPADHPVPRRRTLRLRITALYGVPFLLSAVALLALTNILARSGGATAVAPVGTGVDPSAALAQAESHIASQQAADVHQVLGGSLSARRTPAAAPA